MSSPGVIRRKGLHVRCPIYDRIGATYVHCLTGGADQVGDATHMLSYTWGYTIGAIIGTLEAFCANHALDPKRSCIWICCLCNNQHKIVEDRNCGMDVSTTAEEFERIFQGRVMDIGRLICMMAPWDDPTYLKRVWCLFEIYTGMMTRNSETKDDDKGYDDECELFVAMPPTERQRMFDTVILKKGIDEKADSGADNNSSIKDGPTLLYKALANTRVENGEASVIQDKERILSILGGPNADGFVEVNSKINQYLRGWMTSNLQEFLDEARTQYSSKEMPSTTFTQICNNVAMIFHANSEHTVA